MRIDPNDDLPDLTLLAGEYWHSHFIPSASTHELESLKLYARIVWPSAEMHNSRRIFLAQSALKLMRKYDDDAYRVQNNKDGIRRSAAHRRRATQVYTEASNQSKAQLFEPSGGLGAALQRGTPNISQEIQRRLNKVKVAVWVADFILRYMGHIKDARRAASINKAAFFIENGGYKEQNFPIPRHRSEIIQAWSQAKPSIIFSVAAFYSEPIFLSNILEEPDPWGVLDEFYSSDLRRERFFGIVRYCETQLTSLVPARGREPLLNSSPGMSVLDDVDLCDCYPILTPFSEEEFKKVSMYKAPV